MKLSVQNVKKSYGSTRAVRGISFEAEGNQIFGLLGPNGAGKTTIIRMIMNIIMPDEGTIFFDGTPIDDEDKNRIGYLPEERGLYKKMVVKDLLLYFSSLKGKSKQETAGRIDTWLERFDLSEWKNRRIEELSKGMSQKLQFIVAVIHDPDIIFLDEPFAGLDPISTDLLRETVLDLGEKGKTVLLSTHIMEQAEKMCRRILIIDHGKEVLKGSLDDIKSQIGRKNVVIEFEGDRDIVENSGLVTRVISYPRWVEAELKEGKTTDELLAFLVGKISIRRFEQVAPSLHKIFINRLGNREDAVE